MFVLFLFKGLGTVVSEVFLLGAAGRQRHLRGEASSLSLRVDKEGVLRSPKEEASREQPERSGRGT